MTANCIKNNRKFNGRVGNSNSIYEEIQLSGLFYVNKQIKPPNN